MLGWAWLWQAFPVFFHMVLGGMKGVFFQGVCFNIFV